MALPITKGMLKLARQIDATFQPAHIPVEPGEGCAPNDSFRNVAEITKRFGGTVQHGWRLREQPSSFVEGQFHAVWRRPGGALIDVTPTVDGHAQIIFLPDSNLCWEGEPVNPRRLSLHEQPCYCGSGMPFRLCHGMAED